jgi:hypothetical protein
MLEANPLQGACADPGLNVVPTLYVGSRFIGTFAFGLRSNIGIISYFVDTGRILN